MGRHSVICKDAFSNLLDLATDDSSLTVFDSGATTLSTTLRQPEAMRALRLPVQGRTNIGAGVKAAVDCIIRLGRLDVHHVLVLLSDGAHNVGPAPHTAFQEAKRKLTEHLKMNELKLSILIVGISSTSDTSVGMRLRSTLETVTLDGLLPIYYVESVNHAQGALARLTTDLQRAVRRGCLLSIRSLGARGGFIQDAGRPAQEVIDEFVLGSKDHELTLLFAGRKLPSALDIRSLGCQDEEPRCFARVILEETFDLDLVASAIDKIVNRYSVERIAGASKYASTAATELGILANQFEAAARQESRRLQSKQELSSESSGKKSKSYRLNAFRAATTTVTAARELKNKLSEIAALSSATSREQAHFLTGATTKYGAKALVRAAAKKNAHEHNLLSADLRQRLRDALLRDARSRIDKNVRLAQTVRQSSSELESLLLKDDGAWFVAAASEAGDLGLSSAVSYVSLQSNYELLTEWINSDAPLEVDEYEHLVAFGLLGVPIQLERRAATLMNPFEIDITRVDAGSVVDSASLAGALRGGSPVTPPEGGRDVEDLLLLIDPALPHASALALASPISECLTSMTLCRDLFMYQGISQRIALHAHALFTVIGLLPDSKRQVQADIEAEFKRAFKGRTVYQCPRCRFGPVDHHSCSDLFTHHHEQTGNAVASNACPRCSFFSESLEDWDSWNGELPSKVLAQNRCESKEQSSSLLSSSHALLALRIGYSARQIWRRFRTSAAEYRELFAKISDWRFHELTESDGVVHAVQFLLVLWTTADTSTEICWESALSSPALSAVLLTEVLARRARNELTSSSDCSKSLKDEGKRRARQALGISDSDEKIPQTLSLLEAEPPDVQSRRECDASFDIENTAADEAIAWVESTLQPYVRAFSVCRCLQQILTGNSWLDIETDLENDAPEHYVHALTCEKFATSLDELCELKPQARRRQLVTAYALAHLFPIGADRKVRDTDEFFDARELSTTRAVAVELRMDCYYARVYQKMQHWKAVGTSMTIARARAADIGQYESLLSQQRHAHGHDRQTFWGLWHAARFDGHDGDKVRAFLRSANADFHKKHAPSLVL